MTSGIVEFRFVDGLAACAQHYRRPPSDPRVAVVLDQRPRRSDLLLGFTPRQYPAVSGEIVGCDLDGGIKIGKRGRTLAHPVQCFGTKDETMGFRQRPYPAASVGQPIGGL